MRDYKNRVDRVAKRYNKLIIWQLQLKEYVVPVFTAHLSRQAVQSQQEQMHMLLEVAN